MMKPSDALRQEHGIAADHHVAGHRIVVSGFYFAWSKAQQEKVRRAYREEFTLEPAEHRTHGHGALSHILTDKFLLERLAKKDPEFRAIQTHEVVEHENLLKPVAAE